MDSGEDARKKRQTTKRDCGTEVVNEKPKKLKKEDATTDGGGGSISPPLEKLTTAPKTSASDASSGTPNQSATTTRPTRSDSGAGQDLESALNSLTLHEQEEPISDKATLSFRMGHAGDASTLAAWYRKSACTTVGEESSSSSNDKNEKDTASSTSDTKEEEEPTPAAKEAPEPSSSSLEIWLEKGLGNEDTPPSLFALLGHVKVEGTSSSKLAAAALLTLCWENSTSVLRVEWVRVDSELETASLIERRLWLRLAALGLMTGCDLHVVEEQQQQPQPPQEQPPQQQQQSTENNATAKTTTTKTTAATATEE